MKLEFWHLVAAAVAGWANRRQQDVIGYLLEENRALRQQLTGRRLRLKDEQRRRLAVKGKKLGWKLLCEVASIVTPDTIMAWHRKLVAKKWDYSSRRKRIGRPPTEKELAELIVRMAKENPTWGYRRIVGALKNLGLEVARGTVANVLKEHGLEPAPERGAKTSWRDFLKAHWDVLAACDFTTVEVWTKAGLVTYYVLVVIELATRRVHLAGITHSPDGAWMKQIGRNLTDPIDGFLRDKKYLIMNRDTKYTKDFKKLLRDCNVKPVLLAPRSPNLNAYCERSLRSLKEECLNRMIFFGERPLRYAAQQCLDHYHHERNHQGLHNRLIDPNHDETIADESLPVQCRQRLGGLLRFYHRKAA